MNTPLHGQNGNPRLRGFSLIELLVVAAVGAIVFTAGALAWRVIANNHRTATTFQEVALPSGVGDNFYPGSALTSVDSYVAPNFGRCGQADVMRTLFLEDVEKSIAVFMLPRGGNTNTIRGRTLNLYNVLPQALDTPAAFRSFLLGNPDTASAAQVFINYRGAPPDTGSITTTTTDPDTGAPVVTTTTGSITNVSIFLLQPSGSNTQLWVRAVYEVDYVNLPVDSNDNRAPDVPCVFASVRRYVSDTLTHYYDCVYREADITEAGIPCAHFERGDRAVYTEGTIDRFKKAANQPFYLLWWPDPGLSKLKGTTATTYASSVPQSAYSKHEGQTSYFFIIPQFPAL
jgi:prepilin-type N-terminal cleavage/methylation domain-containing protein